MTKKSLYIVCKTLDQPVRIVGLPLDEFIITIVLSGIFFMLGKLILSMVVALLCIILLRLIKRGQGSGWLLNILYWYMPNVIIKTILRFTPASNHREWIS